jgi:lysozyme family protein
MGFILPHEEEFARGHHGDERYVVAEHVKGDPGGTTKYGIDQASHPKVDVENLTRDEALAIYQHEWDQMHLDGLPDQVAMTMFDIRVNGGQPVRWLQNAINHLRAPGTAAVAADGKLGPATRAAANAVDPAALAQAVIAQRVGYYDALVEGNPARFAQFSEGWHNRNRDLSDYVARPAAEQTPAQAPAETPADKARR